MRRSLLAWSLLAVLAARAEAQTSDPNQALVNRYCVTCHNQRLKTAKLECGAEIQVQTANLDGFTLSLNTTADNIAPIAKSTAKRAPKGAARPMRLAPKSIATTW